MRCRSFVSSAAALIKSESSNLEYCFAGFARSLSTGGALKEVLKDKIPDQQVDADNYMLLADVNVITSLFFRTQRDLKQCA